ncbi:MAG TPA: hypothetical protein VLB79_02075 [Solirubrobacterales bacterium]|nr:hypothetical protein [Solirubrobacterales bacterium]
MVSLFSVIGLAFDLVGAGMLALGLFRPAKLLHPGGLRSPETAAEDQAYLDTEPRNKCLPGYPSGVETAAFSLKGPRCQGGDLPAGMGVLVPLPAGA